MTSAPKPSTPTLSTTPVEPPIEPVATHRERSPVAMLLLALLVGGGVGLVAMNPELLNFQTGPTRPRPIQRSSQPAGSFKTSYGPFDSAFDEMGKTRRGKLFQKAARLLKE